MVEPDDSPPSPPLEGYEVLAGPAEAESRVQRSRFICRVVPARTETEVRQALAQLARQYHDARHLCHAWRLGPPDSCQEVRNDAGEPGGTAGDPILAALRQAAVTDCVAAVARYFGGVKLGTGGLARAYGEVTAEALRGAPVTRVLLGAEIILAFAYPHERNLTHLLAACRGCKVSAEYTESITWRIWLPRKQVEPFLARATDVTAGEARIGSPVPAGRAQPDPDQKKAPPERGP